MGQNISVIDNLKRQGIVVIHDIRFKGKRRIHWADVEDYLKRYVGEIYVIEDVGYTIHIGREFSDEYSGSVDTARLKGALAKAKANAAQEIPELIRNAQGKRYKENLSDKHNMNAKFGWYRFGSRFALPVSGENGKIERYNVFCGEILVRHAADGKMYLYDMVNIKKETSTPL